MPQRSDKAGFYQINLHRASAPTTELNCLLNKIPSFIVLIQEPLFKYGKVQGLNRRKGNIIHASGASRPRTCIYVSKDWNVNPLYHLCTRDLTVMSLKAKKSGNEVEMIICSAYFPFDSVEKPPTDEFVNLVIHCNTSSLPLLAGIDANAHHFAWGSTDINDRGGNLLEFILASNMMINNLGCKPTFVTATRSEVLDITLSTPGLHSHISNWRVTESILTSDHRCIQFDVDLDPQPTLLFRNPASTNWDIFLNKLVMNLDTSTLKPPISDVADLDTAANELQEAIINAYELACPLREHKAGQSLPYYATDDKRLRSEVRRAFNHARSPKHPGTWADFHHIQRLYKAALKKKSRVCWKEQCSSINSLHDSAKMFKILSEDPIQMVGSLRLPSGEFTETLTDTYKLLVNTHFPDCIIHDDNNPPPGINFSNTPSNLRLIEQITSSDRIKWAMNSFAPFKSPGMDRIFPALLQKSIPHIIDELKRIFVASLKLKYVPKMWRGTRVVFTPKPGTMDYSKANNFRPISLTSFFLKTLEKLIDRYIRDGPLSIKPIHFKQNAYQPGKSCDNALHNVVASIEEALNFKEFAIGCFIDISGAFNNITFRAITNACHKFGIDQGITEWIYFMLRSRIIYTQYGTSTILFTVTKGSPQGGVLPPLLWCLVIDEIITILNDLGQQTEGFSDDLAIVLRGKFIPTLCDILQSALNKISNWCTKNELSINPAKTKMIIFTNRKKIEGVVIPTINGIEILLVKEVIYLGILLDYLLSWIPNIERRIQKATAALWQCRKAYGKSWGLSPKVLYWIYTSVIRPILLYGSFLWSHTCNQKTIIERLNKFQRIACKAITGAWHSAPTAAIETLLNLTPLHILVETEAISTFNRLTRDPNTKVKNIGHSKTWFDSIQLLPDIHTIPDSIKSAYRFDGKFNLLIPSRTQWSDGTLPDPNNVNLYTDGSLINKSAGAGIYCESPSMETSIPLGTYCSIYLAEVMAVTKCFHSLVDKEMTNEIISIHTDSQAVIKALSSNKFSSALTLECWESLNELSHSNEVNVIWVPGHTEIPGNEKADELARKGALSKPMGPEPIVGTPYSNIKFNIKIHRTLRFSNHWLSQEGCRQAKNNISLNKKHSKFLINISRIRLKVYAGVMTGHFDFNKHLTNLGKRQDPGCDLCGGSIDSADHYLCRCPAFISSRYKCLGNYVLKCGTIKTLHPRDILRYICSTGRFLTKYGV